MPLYNRIRQYRQKHGLSLPQLAETIGCDLGFLWRQEMQKVPTPDALKVKIARALDEPIAVLFFQDEPPQEAATPARPCPRTPTQGALAYA